LSRAHRSMMNGWQFARSDAADCDHLLMNSVMVIGGNYHTPDTLETVKPSLRINNHVSHHAHVLMLEDVAVKDVLA
jgi:hypothetical protein